MSDCRVRIKLEPYRLDPAREFATFLEGDQHIGATASFIGTVRGQSQNQQPLEAMALEHYPIMTEAQLARLCYQQLNAHQLSRVSVSHRIGVIRVCEPIVVVICCSRHRHHALRACDTLVESLKTQVPLWKCEHTRSGERHFVTPAEIRLEPVLAAISENCE